MAKNVDDCCVRLRGLPFDCTKGDIKNFFSELELSPNEIIIAYGKQGRRNGEAFVKFENREMAEKAMEKDHKCIGRRYIEIFRSSLKEMRSVNFDANDQFKFDDGCVKLRGLPFDCTEEDIRDFFADQKIASQGIVLTKDHSGRSSGEAYVQFASREMAEEALLKNLENMGRRYIEIFRCSLQELRSARLGYKKPWGPKGGSFFHGRERPYEYSSPRQGRGYFMRNMNTPPFQDQFNGSTDIRPAGFRRRDRSFADDFRFKEHWVHMRGLPFNATAADIDLFFKPIKPIEIRLISDSSGRASGEADVEFASHEDAIRAMGRDMAHMNHRYIELFLNSGNSPNQNVPRFGGPTNFYRSW